MHARKLQPGILINNRASIPGDFDTPEQHIGDFQNKRPWETCMTITSSWGWEPGQVVKSSKMCISILASTAGGDGNLLLNLGPKSDGTIEPEQVKVLKEVGEWLRKNGTSIYGTRGGFYYPTKKLTSTYKNKNLFLHLLDIKDEKLVLPAIKERKIIKAFFLTNGNSVEFKNVLDTYEFKLPKELPDKFDTVLVIEFDKILDGITPIKTALHL
jgi:alpha-L-fucosidase